MKCPPNHYICVECKIPVHQHHFWLGKDGKKRHFNCQVPEQQTEAQKEVHEDNGVFLLGLLESMNNDYNHGEMPQ